MFAEIQSVTIIAVPAMQHFLDVFKDDIANYDAAISDSLEMVSENTLQNRHRWIISQKLGKRKPP